MLEMIVLHVNICLTPFTPLVNSQMDNFLVRIPQELNHQHYGGMSVYTLLHGRLYLTVNWTGVWAVHRTQFSKITAGVSLAAVSQLHECNVQINCYAEFLTSHCKWAEMASI